MKNSMVAKPWRINVSYRWFYFLCMIVFGSQSTDLGKCELGGLSAVEK